MSFSGESEFANWQSGFKQGRKFNSTLNAYKIMLILITRAKVMVLWSFTKNQTKCFWISNSDHINCSSYFSHQVQCLRSGGEKFQVKKSTVATRTKIHKLNARIRHYSTLFTLLEMTLFMRRDTIHSTTTQIRCTLHKIHWNGNRHWTKQ